MVRRSLFFLFVLSACHGGTGGPRPPAAGGNGPDAILVRMPREGGVARAYRWGRDTAIWTSNVRAPALERLLAFDAEEGSLAYVDTRGVPGRLDLRLGSAGPAAPAALISLTSADGWAIYGLTAKRDVSRLTPSGTWTFKPDFETRELIPLIDGSLMLLSDDGRRSRLRRLRPPEPRVTDTASVPLVERIFTTDLGDRVYFASDSGLAGVRTRDLARTRTIKLRAPIVDATPTPSGDRVFVALRGKRDVTVIDRFAESIAQTIDLPDAPTALRMDPDGQYVLARTAGGDSVRIIAVGTARWIGTLRSDWRPDLPLVAPDGGLALVQDGDVVIVDAETHRERLRYLGGAADFWTLIRWNGFRPRAAGLDEPVRFASDDSARANPPAADSAPSVIAGTLSAPAVSAAVPAAARAPEARPAEAPVKQTFTLSFAALLSEERAKAMAASIKVDGRPSRVVPGMRDGTPIFRIVYGPFDSRDAAEKAGKRSGLPYWVYEGAP
jgi:cell division septation protein DedD